MKWRGRGGGGRIEDRRGAGGLGGGGIPIPMGKAGGGLGLVILVVYLLFSVLSGGGGGLGVDPGTGGFGQAAPSDAELNQAPADDPAKFVDFVTGDVEAVWTKLFNQSGQTYEKTIVVLYEQGVSSGCGNTPSTVGPFYCPLDRKVYIDLSFYRLLQSRFGAPGDFAQAYVIAHEIGHHVQNLRGKLGRGNASGRESIATELQADCLAGAWARSAEKRDLLEAGDLDEGMTAAAAVGDDAIQRQSEGQVRPETWTHGSSEQRRRAFRRGYQHGTLDGCGL